MITLSWGLHPWNLSWIFPLGMRIIFSVAFVFFIAQIYVHRIPTNNFQIGGWIKNLLFLLCAFLVVELVITLYNNPSAEGLFWFVRFSIKYIYLILLILFLNEESTAISFDIYSNIAVGLVLLSSITLFCIYVGLLNIDSAYCDVSQGGVETKRWMPLTVSGFDGFATALPKYLPSLYRMQSFSYEPGGFALAVLPALYWFVYVRKYFIRAAVIMFGIIASWSLGALLAIVGGLIFAFWNRAVARSSLVVLAFGLAIYVVSHAVIIKVATQDKVAIQDILAGDRRESGKARIEEIKQISNFLRANPNGLGIHNKSAVETYSVGYFQVFQEVGILGGLLYLSIICVLGGLAIRAVLGKCISQSRAQSTMGVALGVSVLTSLFFGLQRERPDTGYWEMWIYASFVVWYLSNGKEEQQTFFQKTLPK
ncbi:hypothetical protein GALL_288020 [mine drainage metagenome]|uniref:O-antigen ligase n=1 Tax=mine drainage metagenome TaxID=410659 RepID=A0A1J5R017_9ZZZZ